MGKILNNNIFRRGPIFLLFIFFVLSSSGVLAVEEGGSYGLRPANPREDEPKSESIFIRNIEPGETINEAVDIYNHADEEQNLVVYAADSVPSSDGGFACEQFVDVRDEIGAWINLEPTTRTIAPNSSERIEFSITAPFGASPGEHNGCILVAREDPEKIEQEASGITLSFRSGAKVQLTIPGEMIRDLTLESFGVESNGGKKYSVSKIKNSGNVSVETDIDITINNLFGRAFHRSGGVYSILKEDTGVYNLEIPKSYWGGIYSATFKAQYNKNSDSSNPDIQFLTEKKVFFVMFPAIKALLIELLVLAVIIWLVFKYVLKKKIKSSKKAWKKARILNSTTLASVAYAVGAESNVVAEANKLPPSAMLERGDFIYVPKPTKTSAYSKFSLSRKSFRVSGLSRFIGKIKLKINKIIDIIKD